MSHASVSTQFKYCIPCTEGNDTMVATEGKNDNRSSANFKIFEAVVKPISRSCPFTKPTRRQFLQPHL